MELRRGDSAPTPSRARQWLWALQLWVSSQAPLKLLSTFLLLLSFAAPAPPTSYNLIQWEGISLIEPLPLLKTAVY